MYVLTALGYVAIVHRRSGWWEVQRGVYRAASDSLPRALWFLGFDTPEARAIAGSILKGDRSALAETAKGTER